MTILAEHPDAPLDLAALAGAVEAFITRPIPYELGDGRAQLRGDTRTTALAYLLGDLTDLLEHGRVTAETVTAAILGAIHTGTELQRTRTTAA